jgi:NAD(P)-dependent dehydrogenase (short-subunit alcohol dehydrogenase family)
MAAYRITGPKDSSNRRQFNAKLDIFCSTMGACRLKEQLMQPTAPSQPLKNQVALITGANTGIGRVTALALARAGAQVVMAGRSLQRHQPVLDEIAGMSESGAAFNAQFLPLELSDLGSVRACANQFLSLNLPLHLLINNAGLAGARGLTADGFEMMFGVNHLGHFLLTQLLLQRIRESGPARIITVASRAHRRAPRLDWDALRRPTQSATGIREYGVSKLANVLFSSELARRVRGTSISTYSLHPGVVDTDVWRSVPSWLRPLLRLRGLITPEEGARTTLYCAWQAPQTESGLYYADSRIATPSDMAQDMVLAHTLWERSAEWVRTK